MTRKAQVILLVVSLLATLAVAVWLASRAQTRAGSGQTREVTDMTSRRFHVPASPTRVLSLCTSATDTVVALGESRRLAAIDEYSRPVGGVEHAAVIGKGNAVSKEQVLALKIDLAFIWWYQDDAAAMLEGLGVPVVRIRSGRATEVPSTIRLVGDCLGCPDKADALAVPVEQFLTQAPSRPAQGRRPVTYLELYSPFKTVGRNSYMNDLIELAGGTSIAADATGTVILSAERLIEHEPEVILVVEGFGDVQSVASRPGMSDLEAVRAGRVYVIGRDLLIAGPSLPKAVEKLRAILADQGHHERQ